MPFKCVKLEIKDVLLLEPKIYSDERGSFIEIFKQTDFAAFGIKEAFIQYNLSISLKKNTIRGLHYQMNPKAQSKLIHVLKGSIADVAVDIRKGSPTYGRWISTVISDKNRKLIYVPAGFAHGFCTLEDDTEVLYQCSETYSAEHERGIIWNDPVLKVSWSDKKAPVLSAKDAGLPAFNDIENNFTYGG